MKIIILAHHLSQETELLFSAWTGHGSSLWVLQDPASEKDWSDKPLFRKDLLPLLTTLLVIEAECLCLRIFVEVQAIQGALPPFC